MFHSPQQIGYSLFRREASEVEYGRVRSGIGRNFRGQFLEMREHNNLFCLEPILQKLFLCKAAGGQEMINAFLISSQPAVEICLGHQEQCRTRWARVTTLSENVPELSAAAALTRPPF